MLTPEQHNLGVEATKAIAAGDDPELIPCPTCGGNLRAEVRTEWWPIAHVSAVFNISVSDLMLHPDIAVTSFGLVKVGAPWAACMHCGSSYNMSAIEDVEGIVR